VGASVCEALGVPCDVTLGSSGVPEAVGEVVSEKLLVACALAVAVADFVCG
jgi:hypothetical protein